MKFKITFLLLLSLCAGFAQVTNQGKPLSWELTNLDVVKPFAMPAFDLAALQAEDKANELKKDMPWRFGYEFFVDHNLSNSGKWYTLPNGDRIWRIRYKSEGAKTLNFLFSDFYMPAGAKVYLYNDAHTDLLGAYDAKQNNAERVLGTWLVKGQDIWIEYYEPAAVTGQGKLEIFKVVHGYRTSDGFLKSPDDDLNGSGNCNYDVDCTMGAIDNLKDINKKAVGLIITNNSGFCSGSLVNNTSNDGTPYFLTANHCYSNPSQWAFRFNWISPNPVCAANTNSTNTDDYLQTVSGATLRARNAGSDFCLVEITANIPEDWDLVYAGWDRSDDAPSSSFGIHHPSGDIMKSCYDDDAPTAENDGEADLWIVGNWELGVTEGGSSGSPLFDNEGRIIGQLFYGAADCNGTSNNGGYDAYGRFATSWSGGATRSARLSDWLDPTATDVVTLDYYPPSQVFALDARATIVTLDQEACTNAVTPVLRLTNRGTQTLTSAQINYNLNNGAPVVINWTGMLATNAFQNIQLPQLTTLSGSNTLTYSITTVNGVEDEATADNTAVSQFNVLIYPVGNVELELNTDFYGEETSWELIDQNGVALYSGDNYGDRQTTNVVFNLTNEGCYTFAIYDSEEDGICCDFGPGSYTLTTADGVTIATGGSFSDMDSVIFALTDTMLVSKNTLQNAVSIYPNPSAGMYNVTVSGGYQNLTYQVYNILGQDVTSGTISANGTVNITNAANGVYVLKVTEQASGKTATFKLVKE